MKIFKLLSLLNGYSITFNITPYVHIIYEKPHSIYSQIFNYFELLHIINRLRYRGNVYLAKINMITNT